MLITVPNHLAEAAGLLGGKIRVRYGESGRQRALRLSRADDGWVATQRRNVLQVFVRELAPKGAAPLTELEYCLGEDGLDLTLPTPWELADPHVVVRQPVPK